MKKKKKLQELYKGVLTKKKTDKNHYHLIYLPWVKNWKFYIEETVVSKPDNFTNEELLCHDHKKLKYDPSILYECGNLDKEPNFMLISVSTWETLVMMHGNMPTVVTCQYNGIEIATEPNICWSCLEKQKQIDFEEKLHYQNSFIFVTKADETSQNTRRRRNPSFLFVFVI